MQEVVVSETISKRSIKDISTTLVTALKQRVEETVHAPTQGKREENQRGVVKNSTLFVTFIDRRWNFYVLHFRVFSLPYKMSAKGQINSHKKLSYTHICVLQLSSPLLFHKSASCGKDQTGSIRFANCQNSPRLDSCCSFNLIVDTKGFGNKCMVTIHRSFFQLYPNKNNRTESFDQKCDHYATLMQCLFSR